MSARRRDWVDGSTSTSAKQHGMTSSSYFCDFFNKRKVFITIISSEAAVFWGYHEDVDGLVEFWRMFGGNECENKGFTVLQPEGPVRLLCWT